MAFPQTELPVSVWIAPGADPAGDPGDWTWTEITDDVRTSGGIVIEGGRGDEASKVDPGRCTLLLDNRSGNYSPRNPLGDWYGDLAKNTPLQVRVDRVSDTFTRSVGAGLGWGTATSGQDWTHTSTSAWTVNTNKGRMSLAAANTAAYAILDEAIGRDVDFLYSATPPVVASGAPWISTALVRYSDSSNLYRIHTEFKPANVITVKIHREVDGSGADLIENLSTGVTYTAGQKIWTRVQADGPTIRARIWQDGSSEPTTWTVEYDDTVSPTGAGAGFYQWRFTGNTNSTYIELDDVSIVAPLFTGTVAEWPVRWDQSGNDCVTSIQASGILRRLQQGRSPLRSPLYRQLTRYTPAGYWPLEDGSDATSASSAVSGGARASVLDVTFAADDTLPGAETTLKINGISSRVTGRVLRSTGAGFSALFLLKLNALPGSKTTLIEWGCSGTVKTWRISGDATGIIVDGLDADGTVITGGGAATAYTVTPTRWCAYQLEAVASGGNIDWDFSWHQVGTQTFYAISALKAGTVGRITSFLIPGSTGLTDATFGHIYAGADTLPFVDAGFSLVSNGYAGELASERVARLCAEEGVRVAVEAGDSQAMGRQQVATFLDLLQTIEDADVGVLYEQGTALAYKPYGARLNVASSFELDVAQGHLAAPPDPTDDDQRVRNDVTVQRDSGGSAREADDAHIALNGRYDESVTANVEVDDQLADLAGWRLHLGTWDEMRWPRIELNLARNPSLIPYWVPARVGTRFTIANPPDQVAGEDIDVVIEGYSQTLTPYGWDVALSCAPARPWDVGVTDDTDARVDTDGSTLASSCTSSATSMSVTSTDARLWTTSGAEFPFDLNVGGERVTVTAISGASNPQTFTVTRAVNGISMAHASGTDVRLWSPTYASL